MLDDDDRHSRFFEERKGASHSAMASGSRFEVGLSARRTGAPDDSAQASATFWSRPPDRQLAVHDG